jgi:hypothetical protein
MSDSDVPQSTTRRIEPYVLIPGIQRDGVEKEPVPSFRDYLEARGDAAPVPMADPEDDQLHLRKWVEDGGYVKKPVYTLDPDESFPEGDIPEV